MDGTDRTARRVVVVGGGVAGLSVAARLAQAAVPVTLLEASRLGLAASTRNQGWLHSGGWFALEQPELARLCHTALDITTRFCPDCLDDRHQGMAYLVSRPDTLATKWTEAWTRAGIPFEEIPHSKLFHFAAGLEGSRVQHAFLLPDRAFRPDILLTRMAAVASNAGAEIRTETPVTKLVREGEHIVRVVTGSGEAIACRFVILAADVGGRELISEYAGDVPGWQPLFTLVPIKTHLLALEPEVCALPFCVVDRGGFNHVPHGRASVFGSNRWNAVQDFRDQRVDPQESARIRGEIGALFPQLRFEEHQIVEWAGTMVQAMHVDQIEPGRVPKPTVIDHEHESPRIANLLSLYPGRASLWPHLVEEALKIVLDKLETPLPTTAVPPYVPPSR
jgi:glycerol-3-phosphate dehydrogenase